MSMPEPIAHPRIIGFLGSSRKDGNTGALASAVFGQVDNAQLINLDDHKIAPYDYDNRHDTDDFLSLARLMIEAEAIVFASPVYWYSMSAQMKVFFDRLSGLTKKHKSLGRQLAGKTAFVISTGGGPKAPPCFEEPFALTARYFDMHWGGMLHASLAKPGELSAETNRAATNFATQIKASLNSSHM